MRADREQGADRGRAYAGPATVALPPRVQAIAFAGVLAASTLLFWARSSVLLDDAHIYFRVAENLLSGHGPRFNVGDRHMPITGVGWLLLLAGAKIVAPGIGFPALAKALSISLLVGAAGFLFLLLRDRLPLASILSPLAIFFVPWMSVLCGHDIALALFFGLATIWAFVAERLRLLVVFAAGCYLARGEGAVFFGLLLAIKALSRLAFGADRRQPIRDLTIGAFVAAGPLVAWHSYYALEFGSLLPSTLSAKILQAQGPWPAFSGQLGAQIAAIVDPLWLAPVFAIGALLILRNVPLLGAWCAVHYALLSWLGVAHYFWYYYPVDFGCALAGVVGVSSAIGWVAGVLPANSRPVAVAAIALSLLVTAATLPVRRAEFSGVRPSGPVAASANRYAAYSEISHFLESEFRSLGADRPPTLLVDEIGLFGVFLPSARIVDVSGLAIPVEAPGEFFDWWLRAVETSPDAIVRPFTEAIEAMVVPDAVRGIRVYRRAFVPETTYNGVSVFTLRRAAEPDPMAERLVAIANAAIAISFPRMVERRSGLGYTLFAHAPSEFRYALPVGTGALRVSFGLLAGAAETGSDGVAFEVRGVGTDGREQTLWTRHVAPPTRDLGPSAHSETIALPDEPLDSVVLATLPGAQLLGDWSFWGAVEPLRR